MKRTLIISLFFVAGSLIFGRYVLRNAFSVQASPQQGANDNDRKMASLIRQLTNRSTEDLVETKYDNGTVGIDFADRFQNVIVYKHASDGSLVTGCITSIEEANAFFGRNLETGEKFAEPSIPSEQPDKAEDLTRKVLPDMSDQEYQFYLDLIEKAEQRRLNSIAMATIVIQNNDGAGEGLNDPTAATPEGGNTGVTRGQQRINTFNFGAAIWGAYLTSSVTTTVGAKFDPLTPCSPAGGVLGSAGPAGANRDFANAPLAGTWHHVALANKLAVSDLNGATLEINATFNSDVDNACLGAGTRWYYGLNNTTPGGTINFLVVVLHELGHGLGFSSFVNGSTGALASGFPDVYTTHMFDRTTNKFWNNMTNAERQASALNTGNVLWNGFNVRNASGTLTAGRDNLTGRVQLYTPNPLQGGSSISHYDSACSPNLLMEPAINLGLPIDLDLTRQQMCDIGWCKRRPKKLDFDKDNAGDITIFRASDATWWTLQSTTNTPSVTVWGVLAGDIPVEGDYDGDGKIDQAIWRSGSSNQWWIRRSSDGGTTVTTPWGSTAVGDTPVPMDYDGDGKTDLCVFRQPSGQWWILNSSTGGITVTSWGVLPGIDIPVPGDYDGDGKTDIAIFRQTTGEWWILKSTGGFTVTTWGVLNGIDVPTPGDYDGDGKTDIAIWRSNTGQWWIIKSSNNGILTPVWGVIPTDLPVPADYDGDGKTDLAIWRTGQYWIQKSSTGATQVTSWGLATDDKLAQYFYH